MFKQRNVNGWRVTTRVRRNLVVKDAIWDGKSCVVIFVGSSSSVERVFWEHGMNRYASTSHTASPPKNRARATRRLEYAAV